jgi:site-specific recombinase XerD
MGGYRMAEPRLAGDEARVAGPLPNLGEFLDQFLPLLAMRVAPTTFRTHRENLLSAARFMGSRTVDQIRRADVEEWLASLQVTRNLKPLTLRRHHSTLGVCFEDLLVRGLVERNPCRGIRLPRAEEYAVPYLSPEDLHRIYAACPRPRGGDPANPGAPGNPEAPRSSGGGPHRAPGPTFEPEM